MTAADKFIDDGWHAGTAPELADFHEQIFTDSAQGGLYGSPEDWLPMKRTGHFRRMAVLAAIELGDLSASTIGDFGTGPWGIACVFPKLRAAGRCYGFDVSRTALSMAAAVDGEIADKTTYLASDGETIPLEADCLDIMWAGEVIEHVREPRLFLQEVARVCRDGGRLFLSTPNKNAVYYYARGEEYATGPEHIALMDHKTLLECLALFFSHIRIIGYETSLYPDLDQMIQNETALGVIQNRASHYPEAASGFIVDARVDKALYAHNSRDYRLQEIVWSDARLYGQERATAMRLFGEVHGGSLEPQQQLSFTVECNRIILLFWAHDWSGHAGVDVDGNKIEVDLFSTGGGFRRVEVPLELHDIHVVIIKRNGTRNQRSASDQVIFYKALCYTVTPT